LQTVGEHTIIHVGSVTIGLTGTEHHPRRPGRRANPQVELRGGFTTSAGSRHVLAVVATEGEPLHLPDASTVDAGIDRTIATWRAWSREFAFDGRWSGDVQRSALALKLLIYAPTGAIAAAATTSLPESARGGKNWDYRFAWVRDAAYSVRALVRFGLRAETHAAFSWLLETIEVNGPDLHVFYGLDGGVPHGVTTLDVPGWNGIGPVVDGNRAQDQLQLGVFGDLLALAREYVATGNILDPKTARMLSKVADRTCDLWRKPDSGMWELEADRHYTSSKMGCWQALDAAVHLAESGQLRGTADRWRAEREQIHEWVQEHCWSEALGAYTMVAGGTDLDTSVLLHAASGFDRGPRMAATIDAIVAELGRGPLLYRYSGMAAVEHPFVACSFWLAAALSSVGRHDDASDMMDKLVKLSNDVGLYAEMIDEDGSTFWGNLPQGLSHLGLINAAITIEEQPTK
jgi:GH15 family glucan-1,4-alpha-glucosidase